MTNRKTESIPSLTASTIVRGKTTTLNLQTVSFLLVLDCSSKRPAADQQPDRTFSSDRTPVVACWSSRLSVVDDNRLNKLIRKTSSVVGMELDSRWLLSKIETILDNKLSSTPWCVGQSKERVTQMHH